MLILRSGYQIAIIDQQTADLWRGRCRWYEMAETGKLSQLSRCCFGSTSTMRRSLGEAQWWVFLKSEDQTDCAGNLALRDSGFGSIGDQKAP